MSLSSCPLATFAWYVALVRPLQLEFLKIFQRIVVLKDQENKKAHADSAQIACEAAGSIRTVASLTREDDCLELYSKSLEVPLRNSRRDTIWSGLLYSISQSFAFFAIALVFWYGSRLVSYREFTTKQFFTALMVS